MPRPRILPNERVLVAWRDEGLTQQQMAERVFEQTGHVVSRSAISVSLSRAGLSEPRASRKKALPWTVRGPRHLKAYPARMLRLLDSQLKAEFLDEEKTARLQSWMAWLYRNNAVVAYDSGSAAGFWYSRASEERDYEDGLPIRPYESVMPADRFESSPVRARRLWQPTSRGGYWKHVR